MGVRVDIGVPVGFAKVEVVVSLGLAIVELEIGGTVWTSLGWPWR